MKQLVDKAFLDKLYGFAYRRCSSSHEAEDLSSDIILALIKSIQKGVRIENFHAYVWAIAHRVYADYSEKRKRQSVNVMPQSYGDEWVNMQTDPFEEFIESEFEKSQLRTIKREIAFLSKIYRDVMVMYYLDGMNIASIAQRLTITENAVKQRLFSARQTIRNEVEKVNSSHMALKPTRILFIGAGKPVGNDPRVKAERSFSQSLVYLCKETPRSAKQLAELLDVPMPFIEEELQIQCDGQNGEYGLLRQLDNGKYIANFHIVDAEDLQQIATMQRSFVPLLTNEIASYLEDNKERIIGLPYLNKQNDLKLIGWKLIHDMVWGFQEAVTQYIKDIYYAHIPLIKREFTTFGIAYTDDAILNFKFYGCDGNKALDVHGYSSITYANIYGERLRPHFHCGHNMSTDPLLLMTVRAIGGIAVTSLSDEEKEIAAKAIEEGYIKKKNDMLVPKIVVIDAKNESTFNSLAEEIAPRLNDLVKSTAKNMSQLVQELVPQHLMDEYDLFIIQSFVGVLNEVYEACIERGIIDIPESSPGAEGTWMVVTK